MKMKRVILLSLKTCSLLREEPYMSEIIFKISILEKKKITLIRMLGSPTMDFFPHKHLFLNYSKNITALESKN